MHGTLWIWNLCLQNCTAQLFLTSITHSDFTTFVEESIVGQPEIDEKRKKIRDKYLWRDLITFGTGCSCWRKTSPKEKPSFCKNINGKETSYFVSRLWIHWQSELHILIVGLIVAANCKPNILFRSCVPFGALDWRTPVSTSHPNFPHIFLFCAARSDIKNCKSVKHAAM